MTDVEPSQNMIGTSKTETMSYQKNTPVIDKYVPKLKD